MTRTHSSILLLIAWSALATACGDDDGGGQDAAAMEESCQSGLTKTGCTCGGGRLGVQHCKSSRWSECSCPPERSGIDCVPGMPVVCEACPGGFELRPGICGDGGTSVCPRCDSVPDGG